MISAGMRDLPWSHSAQGPKREGGRLEAESIAIFYNRKSRRKAPDGYENFKRHLENLRRYKAKQIRKALWLFTEIWRIQAKNIGCRPGNSLPGRHPGSSALTEIPPLCWTHNPEIRLIAPKFYQECRSWCSFFCASRIRGSHSVNAKIKETPRQIGDIMMQFQNSLRASSYSLLCITLTPVHVLAVLKLYGKAPLIVC